MCSSTVFDYGATRSRPCDNEEYAQFPSNEIGQRLGETLRRVFCDLHDEQQMVLLEETASLNRAELFEALFVTERYKPSAGSWAMNRFYPEIFSTTKPQRFDESSFQWRQARGPSELDHVALDPDDRDLATMLLSGDDFRPTILVGRVGCGKTSFLKRFIHHVAPKTAPLKDFAFLHLDFAHNEIRGRYFTANGKDEPFDAALDFVLTEYFNDIIGGLPALEDVFEYTYLTENIDRTIETWPEDEQDFQRQEWYRQKRHELDEFNYARIKYLQHTLGKRVIICLDNADRWEMVDQKLLITNALYKQSWHGSGLLLVVRHNALTDLQRHISYSQFRPFKKHLTPPRIDKVLRKRLELLENLLKQRDFGPYYLEDTNLHAKVLFGKKGQLVEFLGKVAESLSKGEAEEFVRRFTNHNVRRMLDFAELYLCSPNTEVWRYLPDIVEPPSGYSHVTFWNKGFVGLQTVVTVAALGNGPFYHPMESSLSNLFCNDSATDPFDTLVRLRVLAFASQRDATPQLMLEQGFAQVGYDPGQVCLAIEKLMDDGLIESRERITDPNAILFTTVAGKYYIEKLVSRLPYLQYMRDGCFLPGLESPIGNRGSLEERLHHTAEFVKFLDEQEQNELEQGLTLNPAAYRKYCGTGFFVPQIAQRLLREIRNIPVIDEAKRDETHRILREVEARRGP